MTHCQIRGARVALAPFFIFCSATFAEVPVVDLSQDAASAGAVTTVTPQTAPATPSKAMQRYASAPASGNLNSQLGDMFEQMQALRQEVQELRGLVEQQANELQQLKQQRKDDYLDLDRRVSELQKSGVTPAGNPTLPTASATAAGSEKSDYDAAYNLLKAGKRDEAAAAFRNFIATYPTADLLPNAYYWLGEAYLAQSQLDQAQEQFALLLKNFPDARKAPDAKFKLGKVYLQQGKKAEAKKLILEVAQGDSEAAAPAKAFLQANF